MTSTSNDLSSLSLDVATARRPTAGFGAELGERRGGGYSPADRNRQRQLDVNNFDAIRISLASPEAIRKWSHGEVTKPETINYRTLKPEHGGLFCERIFGPTKDWECYCGKYKRIRHAGTICDKCGVEVTRAKVRRERMGHIELAAPVAHIWYVKGTPSRLGLLLDITPRNLERVLYFASYLVTDVNEEARTAAVAEIEEQFQQQEAELREDADARIGEIREASGESVTAYSEEKRDVAAEAEDRRKAARAELDKEYRSARGKLDRFKKNGIGATEKIVVRGRTIIEEDEAPNEDRYALLTEVRNEERERIDGEAKAETSGADALAGAGSDLVTSEAGDAIRRIETGFKQEVDTLKQERDEALKAINDLKDLQILTETQYRDLQDWAPGVIKAAMGAEAVYDYLTTKVDLDQIALELRNEMQSSSDVKRKKATKRLRVVESLRKSGNKPHWMIFTALPVIPPELRPMVQLDGGRFATSDLNDLYRRVINRNNRLKRLLDLGAPDIIVRNEKRMLQEAVDALIDNGRRGRVVSGSGKHKLKSLSDMLKGKQGRFRQNLLGKRVDYSGRSVIVVGPDLALDECGLPKRMAIELFKPFVMRRLVDRQYAHNIKAAKRLVERHDPKVWEVLEEVVENYLVLLNRAPTLHRLGIQGFRVRLIDGSAIQLHPLVCQAFNADFDGDQMAVHLPLSRKAQEEARKRMFSVRNLLSPSNGDPIVSPTQDIVLGCYYMTSRVVPGDQTVLPRGWGKVFSGFDEVRIAYEAGQVDLQAEIKVLTDLEVVDYPGEFTNAPLAADGTARPRLVETTVGRVIFNQALPTELRRFYNGRMGRRVLRDVVADCYRQFRDPFRTAEIVNDIKQVGLRFSTIGGMSIAVDDVVTSETKAELLREADEQAGLVEKQLNRGLMTEDERLRELEIIWNRTRDQLAKDVESRLGGQNSVFMMADSGAKGNMNQISQMAGMRGLVLDPQGRIIDIPIRSNFREGLTVLEYFLSTHGARKGLADTALRTADSGYLTRRLVDVAQDVIISVDDCETEAGLWVEFDWDGWKTDPAKTEAVRSRIFGRVVAEDVVGADGQVVARRGDEISDTDDMTMTTVDRDRDTYEVRPGLEFVRPFQTDEWIEKGEPILRFVQGDGRTTAALHAGRATRRGDSLWVDWREVSEEQRTRPVVHVDTIWGARPEKIKIRTVMGCEATHGVCRACYGRNLASGRLVEPGEAVGIIAAQSIGEPGTQLTMRTFHTGGVARADITTGLPRVEELFEARQPKGAALLADREGIVSIEQTDVGRMLVITSTDQDQRHYRLEDGWEAAVAPGAAVVKDKTVIATGPEDQRLTSEIDGTLLVDDRTLYVRNEREERVEHAVAVTHQILVDDGERVTPGQQLTDGAKDPQQILLTQGPDAVQQYMIDEVQKVYRSQGVNTNDKHIEVICRQMLRKVSITYPGDTDYVQDERIDRFEFNEINESILAQGGEPATGIPVLLGITKASLETDSFLSAASFQETTRVLTEAAINGKVDHLRGLKENVIIGKLIPAGSGFGVVPDAEPEVPAFVGEGAPVALLEKPADRVEPASAEELAELMSQGLVPGGESTRDVVLEVIGEDGDEVSLSAIADEEAEDDDVVADLGQGDE